MHIAAIDWLRKLADLILHFSTYRPSRGIVERGAPKSSKPAPDGVFPLGSRSALAPAKGS